MPVVWATAHVTQFAKPGWRYLAAGSGSGRLPKGGFFTTTVDPDGHDFALHVVKISYDHASCTRPGLPSSESSVAAANATFILAATMGISAGTKLACWRSNFELETPVLFEQQADVTVGPGGAFTLSIAVGDFYTVSTLRSATHGSFPGAPVPPSQPRSPSCIVDDFEGVAESQQPRLWYQVLGSWEAHVDTANSSNRVLRQMAESIPVDQWRGKFSTAPATVIGMREWQDVSIAGRFRLPSADAGACLGTRVDWILSVGVVLCIDGSGAWNLSYGNNPLATTHVATGRVTHVPTPGTWHRLNLTTLHSQASAWYDGVALFSGQAIRGIDSGFAALASTTYYRGGPEFDDVSVHPVGPDWDPNPPPPAGCNVSVVRSLVGHLLSTRRCQSNGITAPDEDFLLLPDWRLKHSASGLCAAATGPAAGSGVTLQPCNGASPGQLWKNDYSNIHHANGVPMVLAAYNVTLTGSLGGNVLTRPIGWKRAGDWTEWTFFDSTGQLRNQRTPRDPSEPVKCLALCRDA